MGARLLPAITRCCASLLPQALVGFLDPHESCGGSRHKLSSDPLTHCQAAAAALAQVRTGGRAGAPRTGQPPPTSLRSGLRRTRLRSWRGAGPTLPSPLEQQQAAAAAASRRRGRSRHVLPRRCSRRRLRRPTRSS